MYIDQIVADLQAEGITLTEEGANIVKLAIARYALGAMHDKTVANEAWAIAGTDFQEAESSDL